MLHALEDSVLTLFCASGPSVQMPYKEWLHHKLSLKQNKSWIFSVRAIKSSQAVVYDVIAPPSVRTGSHRVAPEELAYKAMHRKRRYPRRSAGSGDDDGSNWGDDGFDGTGGWGGNDGAGKGGNNYWGAGWNDDDGWWWEDTSDAVFNFIYELACWISLTECLQFVLKKLLDMLTLMWKIRRI